MILDRPLSKQAIESYRELADFAWVEVYLKRQEVKAKIRDLQTKLRSLNALAPGNEDLRKKAHAGLKELEAESIKRLAFYLNENRRGQNPFNRIDRMKDLLVSFFITPEMIDAAVDSLPESENHISVKKKQEEKAKLEKSIEKGKADLEKVSPPSHFRWQGGAPDMDLCENFEKRWRSMQGRLNARSGPLGFALADGKEADAYRQLGIRSAMNEKAKLSPIPR